jgi:hypothetical protein
MLPSLRAMVTAGRCLLQVLTSIYGSGPAGVAEIPAAPAPAPAGLVAEGMGPGMAKYRSLTVPLRHAQGKLASSCQEARRYM